jgi:hypothetical protein
MPDHIRENQMGNYLLTGEASKAPGWRMKVDASKMYTVDNLTPDWRSHEELPQGVFIGVYAPSMGQNGIDFDLPWRFISRFTHGSPPALQNYFKDPNEYEYYFMVAYYVQGGRNNYLPPAFKELEPAMHAYINILYQDVTYTVRSHFTV